MLLKICEKLDISHYAFDVTRKCFFKYVSKCHNYEPLVYYAVNNHMHWVSDKNASLSLIRNSQDINTKFKSICLTDDETDKVNIYDLDIKENISINDLQENKNSTIIYTKNNLNEELDEIIKTYKYIPAIKNDKYNITQIHIKQFNIYLVAFDEKKFTYQQIQELCKTHKIEWKNQTLTSFVYKKVL